MKINEVLTNDSEEIDEATPFGLGARMKSAVMGKLGSTSAQAQGDVGKRANDLFKAFEYWASRGGPPMNQVPKAKFIEWVKAQGIPAELPPEYKTVPFLDLTDKDISTAIWTSLARGAYGAQMKSTGGKPGQATFGQKYGIQSEPPPPAMSKKQRNALLKAIKSGALSPEEAAILNKMIGM